MTTATTENKECCQIQLTRHTDDDNIFILTLTGNPHPANVFSMSLLRRLDQLLDQVEDHLVSPPTGVGVGSTNAAATTTTTTAAALILTGNGKFFSAGFDLHALTGQSHRKKKSIRSGGKGDHPPPLPIVTSTNHSSHHVILSDSPHHGQQQELVEYSWKILARLLVFPAPTIAFLNGHAFGLGLFLALACDHRVMEQQPQQQQQQKVLPKLCLPEITIGLPLGSGFAALAKCKLRQDTLRTAALTGKQYGYDEALQAGIIDAIVVIPTIPKNTTDTIPPQVISMAQKLLSTSEKGNLSAIKMELYCEIYQALMTGKSRSKL
jgi:enoyl-CoA hydratase/carnithine racemase